MLTWNVGPVYGQLSRLEPEAYVETAEVYYKQAIAHCTALSGRGLVSNLVA